MPLALLPTIFLKMGGREVYERLLSEQNIEVTVLEDSKLDIKPNILNIDYEKNMELFLEKDYIIKGQSL